MDAVLDDYGPKKCDTCGKVREDYSTRVNMTTNVQRIVCRPCEQFELEEAFCKNGYMSTKLVMDVALENYYIERGDGARRRGSLRVDIIKAVVKNTKAIEWALENFRAKVWKTGLQKLVRDAATHGMSGETPNVDVLVFASAGRVMITLDSKADNGPSVTMITLEDEDRNCGLQGISATVEQAVGLINHVIDNWSTVEIKPDPKVGF